MAKGRKAPVTLRAVIVRINRRLAADGLALRAARGRYGGNHYLVDTNRNVIKPLDEDIAAYARRIGALAAWEEIA
jgi:hypothetical protein